MTIIIYAFVIASVFMIPFTDIAQSFAIVAIVIIAKGESQEQSSPKVSGDQI